VKIANYVEWPPPPARSERRKRPKIRSCRDWHDRCEADAASRCGSRGFGPELGDAAMPSVRYVLCTAALALAAAAPALAQTTPSIRHMLVQYRPASGSYCADMEPRDAILRPSEARCQAEPGWIQQRMVMARR
jgi:hypothetical protein